MIDEINFADNSKIKNIKKAKWFCTMEHYPKTIGDLYLLLSIMDKMYIFKNLAINNVIKMNAYRLDIIYAVLRINLKMYNKYLDYAVKKIFCNNFKKIFNNVSSSVKGVLFDQLLQDMDDFVCEIIKTEYPNLDKSSINKKFKIHVTKMLKMPFYNKFLTNDKKSISNDSLYDTNMQLFTESIDDFITYTKITLTETYDTMKIFIDKIFDNNSSTNTIDEIILALNRHIDIDSLFNESCLELDIYNEQKMNDDYHDINKISSSGGLTLSMIGYTSYDNQKKPRILQPFLDNNFADSHDKLLNMLTSILIKYRTHSKIIDNTNTTLENYYILMNPKQQGVYQHICQKMMNTKKVPDTTISQMILRLLSRIYNVKIQIYGEDFMFEEIVNTNSANPKTISIYKNDGKYYTIYPNNKEFKPCFKQPCDLNIIYNKFINECKNKSNNQVLHMF